MSTTAVHHWSAATIADAIEVGVRQVAEAIEIEQAVRGLDSLDELDLHPILHEALGDAGYGVHPEQRYPRDRIRRRKSEGERCDIVLTPDARPLSEPDAEATLFAPKDAVPLEQAFWLEVKVVRQFAEGGPNSTYASDLQTPVRSDVRKLKNDESIRHAGVLLVLFAASEEVARHDLDLWKQRCWERGYSVDPPCLRLIPIGERLGNAVCAIALFRVGD